jgi:hypothetical protein
MAAFANNGVLTVYSASNTFLLTANSFGNIVSTIGLNLSNNIILTVTSINSAIYDATLSNESSRMSWG